MCSAVDSIGRLIKARIPAADAKRDACFRRPDASGEQVLRLVSTTSPSASRAPLVAADEYTLVKCLSESSTSEIWTASSEADGRSVVLKAYFADRDKPPSSTRIHAECELLRAVAGKGIPAVLDLVTRNPPVLVLERPSGLPLSEWLAQGSGVEPAAFIEIALQLSEILGRMHAERIIHGDVSPANVSIEPRTLAVQLTDFAIARPLGSIARRSTTSQAWELTGRPHYVAPERTGWINRGCDLRSDLYTLGATLYHLLTGRPPFEGNTAIELIHAHIARLPAAPAELRPGIPDVIGRLVLKLLRKEPEERYQSARALRFDLVQLREQLARTGSLDARFELGSAEAPERPRFVRKLHGRRSELERLERLFARAGEEAPQAVLIRGEPGVGKSALADALRPRIAEARGYLALGKFELDHERPYSAWVAALESLVQQLLLESDTRLRRWRAELREGLGNIAQALVDLVPDLALVLGEVPPVPTLGPSETQARLAVALQRFVRVCARPERPLAIFLDDIQWSDASSRFLIEEILSGDRNVALLLIAAQRTGEDGVVHSAVESLRRNLTQRGVELQILDLPALSVQATVELLAEALCRSEEDVRPLAALIERKTSNLPLLVREFIEHIHERGLLHYVPGVGWSWDPAQIAAADIPDGAVALMTSKMSRLSPAARKLLQFASCVSGEFDGELLCELGGGEHAKIVQQLYDLSDSGLLAPCSGGFRFAHDRIRETARSMLSDAERARLHYDIARWLLARTPEAEQLERAFEIVDHLNRGLTLIGEAEREAAIRLNFRAGKQALGAGAAATAAVYLDVARSVFLEKDWQADPNVGFDLHLLSAECAFQCGAFDAVLALLDALDRRGGSSIQRAQIAAQRSRVFALTLEPEAALRYTLSVLRELGIRWPMHPSKLRTSLELYRIRRRFDRRRVEDFMQPATQLDSTSIARLLVVTASAASLGRVDTYLAVLANCFAMRTQLRHGALPRSGFSFAVLAAFTLLILEDTESARRYTSIALEWGQRFPDPLYDLRTEFHIHSAVNPWIMPRRKALAPLARIAEAASEIGDPEFANYARFLSANLLALAGDPLPLATLRLRDLAESITRSGHRYPAPAECHAVLQLLTEPAREPLEQLLETSDARLSGEARSAEPYVRTLWLMVLCIQERYGLALAQSDALGERLFRVVPYAHIADHLLYRGISCAVLASKAQGRTRRGLCRDLKRCMRRLRRWAKNTPDVVHMQLHLEGEIAALQRDGGRARGLLERAAQRALEQGFLQNAALAHERRGRMFSETRRDTEAAASLAQAAGLYRTWGAELKAAALEREAR
jgi:predicted ATPase/serine/threonine protein kinase